MTMTDPPQPQPTPPQPTPPAPAAPAERTLTQTEVNALTAREAEQARRQALREVADRLGCTIEEAEQMLKDQREQETARLSDIEKRERDIAKREQDTASREANAQRLEHEAKVRDALLDAGVKRDRLKLATKNIEVEQGADDKVVGDAVKAYKEQVPEWFDETTTPPATNTPPGTPSPSSTPSPQPRPSGKPEEDAFARGAERAKRLSGVADAAAGAGGQ